MKPRIYLDGPKYTRRWVLDEFGDGTSVIRCSYWPEALGVLLGFEQMDAAYTWHLTLADEQRELQNAKIQRAIIEAKRAEAHRMLTEIEE